MKFRESGMTVYQDHRERFINASVNLINLKKSSDGAQKSGSGYMSSKSSKDEFNRLSQQTLFDVLKPYLEADQGKNYDALFEIEETEDENNHQHTMTKAEMKKIKETFAD